MGSALLLVTGAQAVAAKTPPAAHVAASGVINACYQKNQGMLRLLQGSQKCRKSEVPISWNMTGIQGPPDLRARRDPPGLLGRSAQPDLRDPLAPLVQRDLRDLSGRSARPDLRDPPELLGQPDPRARRANQGSPGWLG